jgi:ABC-2 type transport system ATP-binding protein
MIRSVEQTPSIEARGVVVKKDRPILDGVEFAVTPGTVTGLIGPSGSGKTTLMRAIVGVQKLSVGQLRVLGMPAGSAPLRRQIGYVSQEPAVYNDVTVTQNIQYFATLLRAGESHVEATIRQVRLEPQRHQLVATLSGGQRARVSLAIALLGDPEVLVLDEPTVGLDPLLRQELWGLFARLADEGKTLLVSSHVMDEAERCGSLLLLRDGKLLWHGTRERLLETTGTRSVEAAFMNMITKKGKE